MKNNLGAYTPQNPKTNFALSKHSIYNAMAIICQATIFFMACLAVYVVYPHVFPYYANSAFTINMETDRIILGIGCLIFLWFALIKEQKIYKQCNHISFAAMILVNYLYFLPGLYMNMFYMCEIEYATIYATFCVLMNILVIIFCKKEVTIRKKLVLELNGRTYKHDYVCLILASLFLIFSLFLNDFKIDITTLFNPDEVYETRLANRITSNGYMYYIWYFIVFGSCIVPTWTVIALEKKQYMHVLFYTLCMFSMYSVSCNRQFLFLYAFAFVFFFLRKNKNAILIIMLAMWMLPCIEFLFFDEFFFSDIIRRLCIVPNVDAEFHVDFFTKNDPDFLKQTWNFYLSRFGINSAYPESIASIVGKEYFGQTINANTGLVGGTFANYGYLSVILGPILYTFALRLFDKFLFKVKHSDILLITAMVIAFNFTNSETWIEQIIIPSWILLYYLSMWIMPLDELEEKLIE